MMIGYYINTECIFLREYVLPVVMFTLLNYIFFVHIEYKFKVESFLLIFIKYILCEEYLF